MRLVLRLSLCCPLVGALHSPTVGRVASRLAVDGRRQLLSPRMIAIERSYSVLERVDNIRSGKMDQRAYRWIEVANGMRALLVSDGDVEQAAAALEVRAGHFQDPAEMPGLAHLTEHMMFLGTEEYPGEGEFKAFLSKNGGSSNAFTGMEATGYHFAVHHGSLPEALKRFASFFSGPLFRRESIEREVHAIDSEYRRNLQSDARRLFQLMKHTAQPSVRTI